jgi:phosphate transport system protein
MIPMERRIQEELDSLKQQLLDMAARVEWSIQNSVKGVQERDIQLMHAVIENDVEIDLAELKIDETCISMLALRQPLAGDLRFVTTALKIVKDIERVGDIAKSIAKHGLGIVRDKPLQFPPKLSKMASIAETQMRKSLDAFVFQDVVKARDVIRDDDLVDDFHKENVRDFLKLMIEEPAIVETMTQILSVNKLIERIGDHATNIAAMVVYMVEGKDIRHLKKQKLRDRNLEEKSK